MPSQYSSTDMEDRRALGRLGALPALAPFLVAIGKPCKGWLAEHREMVLVVGQEVVN